MTRAGREGAWVRRRGVPRVGLPLGGHVAQMGQLFACRWVPLALVAVVALVSSAASAPVSSINALAPVGAVLEGGEKPAGVVADEANGALFLSDRKAGTVTRIASDGTATVILGGLEKPVGLALDGAGRLLIAEEGRDRLLRREPSGALTVLASGIDDPRWIAVGADGVHYVSADGFRRQDDDEDEGDDEDQDDAAEERGSGDGADDDEEDEENRRRGEAILRLGRDGAVTVFADGFEGLEGVAVHGGAVYAVSERLLGERARQRTTLVRIPVTPDGTAGPLQVLVRGDIRDPVGLAVDRLGAVFFTAERRRGEGDRNDKGLILKWHPDSRLTTFATGVKDGHGLAFAAAGHLLAAERRDDNGRLLRFLAPAAPVFAVPAFANQSPFPVTGTTVPNARVDLFVNGAATAVTGLSDEAGAFSVPVPLMLNARNTLEGFATTHAGDGLTSPAAEVTITHDAGAPVVSFQAPPANAFVRRTVTIEAQATDPGGEVASLTLSAGSQPLSATLAPAPPAAAVTATASWDTTTFDNGAHTLTATATDQAGGSTSATQAVLVDNTPPDTEITGGPSGEIAVAEATFTFRGTDNLTAPSNLVFAWSLDGGPFTAFSTATSATFTGLGEGQHTFRVKARDQAGNEDPTPATRSFTVRLGPTITSVDPASGPMGALVRITGTGFVPGATQVAFNGVPAVVGSISATSITTTVPQGATTGPITVTTAQGTATSAQPFAVTGEDFTLSALPTALVVPASGQGVFRVTLSATSGLTTLATLSVTGMPAGMTSTFSAQALTRGQSAALTVVTNGTTPEGTYALTVSATGVVNGVQATRSAATNVQVLGGGLTTLSGQVLDEDAKPVKGALVKLGTLQVSTDDGGNFLLQNPPVGADQLLFVDGGPASTPGRSYPIIPYKVTIVAGQANTLGFTPHLHFQKTTGLVDISNSSIQRIVSDPEVPGFRMTIPAGVTITGWDGQPNTQISIRRVPIDRTPLPPLPTDLIAPSVYMDYFGKQGGGTPSEPIPITFPNELDVPPGTQVELWFYDEAPDGSRPNQWAQYGTGTISDDGSQILPDIDPSTGKPFGQPRFCCGAAIAALNARRMALIQDGGGRMPTESTTAGEPVDLATGVFVLQKTDMVLPGRLPVVFTRHYRTTGARGGPFGFGTSHTYQVLLLVEANLRTVVLPAGARLAFPRQADGTFRNFTDPSVRGAVITETGGGHTLRFKDGTTWTFGTATFNTAFLIGQTDRNGNTIALTRSGPAQSLTTITASDGRQLALTYDSANRVTQITDPLGRSVLYSYDAGGQLSIVMDPAGGVTRYTYDGAGRMLTITDARGITFLTNEYDAEGRVIRQTQADEGVWQFAYTTTGGVITQTVVTDPRGFKTTSRFNGRGYLLSQTDALGQTTTSTRDAASTLLQATTDPLGRKTTFTYDAAGNVLTITDPDSNVTRFEYEPTFNRVTKITDTLNQVTEFTYDANGNLLTTKDPLNNITTITYNQFGQPLTVTDPLNHTTTFAYDANGNLIATTDPLGNVTQRAYDRVSRLISLTDPRGFTTQFQYDALNRVQAIADAARGLTRFSYDPNGNLLSVTDAKNQTTTYTYDSMDRLATRTDGLGRQESYRYDPAGNLALFTDRKNQVSTFAYDNLNRRVGARYADSRSISFAYDSVGRLAAASDSGSGAIQLGYDNLDRLVQEVTPHGAVAYQYDALGRRLRMTANGQQPVRYQYDGASRLTEVAQASLTVGLDYDAAGRRTSLTYPNSTSTSYTYDTASRLTTITHQGPSAVIESLTYIYDAAGNRINLTRANGTASNLPAAVEAAYDAANKQIQIADTILTYDPNGNLTGDGTNTYAWDARNRLVAINGPDLSASFSYDALGRRVSKTINGVATQYLYDGNDVVQEIDEAAVGAAYLRSLNIDEPFIRQSNSSEYYHTDAQGSVLALTDEGGTVQTSYNYEAFGKTTITGASSNPFQYTSRENDETGLYYYRARYYGPRSHRFASEDPLVAPMTILPTCSVKRGTRTVWAVPAIINKVGPLLDPTRITSPYLYAGNNPLGFADPMGLDKEQKECDEGRLFQCRTTIRGTLTGGVCGTLGRLCVAEVLSGVGAAAAVPTCSFAVTLCTGTFVFAEIACLEGNNCL